jgi:hypothetical protein
MSYEATANQSGARAVSARTLLQQRYQLAVMLADVRGACVAAWKPTTPAERHSVCSSALDAEVKSWGDAHHSAVGEQLFTEITALWMQVWNELDAAPALSDLAYVAGASDCDDARAEYAFETKHGDYARMPSSTERFAVWADKRDISEQSWNSVAARYVEGWKYAIDRI